MRDLSLKGRALVGVWLDTGLKSQGKGFGWGVVSAGLKSPFALSYGCVFFFLCSIYWKLFVQTVSGVARVCSAWGG